MYLYRLQIKLGYKNSKVYITTAEFTLPQILKKKKKKISCIYQRLRDITLSFWTQFMTYMLILLHKTLQQWSENTTTLMNSFHTRNAMHMLLLTLHSSIDLDIRT
jgi:hypothetical protein